MKPATRAPGQRRVNLERSGPWIAAVGLLTVLWLVVMSAFLFVPWWGIVLHVVVLGAFAGAYARRARVSPASTVWIPLLAFGAWALINALGVALFTWRL